MTIVPVADFAPDVPAYLSSDNPLASNTYPRVDGSDGPLRAPVEMAAGISGNVRGALAVRSRDGESYVIAGTDNALWQMTATGWINRGSGYGVPEARSWQFAQFGDRVIGVEGSQAPVAWTIGSSSPFAALSGAPTARYVATVEPGFLMLGAIDDGTGPRGNVVRWSGLNDATVWPTPGTTAALAVQSDEQELANGGAVTGIVPAIGGAAAAIFTEDAIYRLEYVGPSAIFSFREADRTRGCVCPNGIASVNAAAYFIAEDGFFAFDGSTVSPIGAGKVDRFFWDSVDRSRLNKVFASVDIVRKIIVWAWPTMGSGSSDRWLMLNYATGRWRYGDDAGLAVSYLFPARTATYTLEELDGLPEFAAAGLDSAGAPSLDDVRFIGGQRVLAGFNASGRLVSFTGAALAARIETGETDSSGKRVFVSGLRPLTDANSATAGVASRERFGDALVHGPQVGLNAEMRCPQRVSGRYVRADVRIPAGASWSYLQGVDVQMRAEGKR